MKLKRSTGALLGVAIALVTTVAIIETNKSTQSDTGKTLYEFTEGDVNAFTINRNNATLSFAKNNDTWQMTEPQNAPADPSSIAFLLNIITSDTIQETIIADSSQLDNYGLESPTANVKLITDQSNHTLVMGEEDFSGTSRYVMTTDDVVETDPVEIYLISKDLENGIERPIDDWMLNESDVTPSGEEKE